MTSLIERIESAEGPSRELDAKIEIALNGDRKTIVGSKPGRFPREPIYGTIRDLQNMNGNDLAEFINAPRYTASIDAALTLVPDGMAGLISIDCGYARLERADGEHWSSDAATPALALCAAALRARGEPT